MTKIPKAPSIYMKPSPTNIDMIIDTLIYNPLSYLDYYLRVRDLLTSCCIY